MVAVGWIRAPAKLSRRRRKPSEMNTEPWMRRIRARSFVRFQRIWVIGCLPAHYGHRRFRRNSGTNVVLKLQTHFVISQMILSDRRHGRSHDNPMATNIRNATLTFSGYTQTRSERPWKGLPD